jgi:hypothetical protein
MHSSVDSSTADIGSPQPAAIPRLGQAERRAPRARPERFSPLPGEQIRLYDSDCELTLLGTLEQISQSGLALAWSQPLRVLHPGAKIVQLLLSAGKDT